MSLKLSGRAAFPGLLLAFVAVARADPLSITIPPPAPPPAGVMHLGAARRPDGATLTVDGASLRLDGQPWMPAMGEFHYSRYPADEWRGELLKMKAGGLDIVSTYVFWIHHEEIEGRWDWSGRRNLREFVQLAAGAGLQVVVRCGPWCHGEVRNGGLPDWTMNRKDWRVRSLDPGFLDQVRLLYGQIAAQLRGLLWKDGGPVIGVQLDNEYGGPAEYLLALKKIAVEAGLDVPLYTRTGWPALQTALPYGEIVPLYGAYAEGFWDRELTSMPGRYWTAFRFSLQRNDADAATEQYGRRAAGAVAEPPYPYVTCEIGGGMMSSYHRRILIHPADVESTVLVKLGSGGVLPGYYMYHGGTNPDGKLTTLMEAQDTPGTNWNDLPVTNYDFQAPIGQFGQLRPQYALLRRLHLFLHDFGTALAGMPAVLPDQLPQGRDDTATLRWAVRSNGTSGFVFVNNYQRSTAMPSKRGVQFLLNLPGGPLAMPAAPVDIPADSRFLWPFNLDLGRGVRLVYATAQPVCAVDEGDVRTIFFAATPGVPAEFLVAGESTPRRAVPGRGPAFQLDGPAAGGVVRVVLLDEADSLALWKGAWRGGERVFLTRAGLVIDGAAVRLSSSDPSILQVALCPAPAGLTGAAPDGVFTWFALPRPPAVKAAVSFAPIRSAGTPRVIPLGRAAQPVAAEPVDADFGPAAVWRITLPAGLDLASDPILRLRYVGDVARITLNGRLLVDDFYNGAVLDLGLRRHAPEITRGDLQVEILPLRRDAVEGPNRKIFMAPSAIPDFRGADSIAELQQVEIVPRYEVRLSGGGAQ